jgi:hypothetical protein
MGSRYENKFKEIIKSLMGVVEGLPWLLVQCQ